MLRLRQPHHELLLPRKKVHDYLKPVSLTEPERMVNHSPKGGEDPQDATHKDGLDAPI